jgi:hypothetical protein
MSVFACLQVDSNCVAGACGCGTGDGLWQEGPSSRVGGWPWVADRGSWLYFVDLWLSSIVDDSVLTVGGPARDFPVVSAVSDR